MAGTAEPPVCEIRDALPSDAEEIIALLALCLGAGTVPRTVEFWRWKHERSPFGPSPVLVAVAPEGGIVAVRAFLRWRWRSGARTFDAVRAVDTATHPAWRGRGLFRRLTLELAERERRRGTAFVFNTPNRSSGPGYLKMGWHSIGRVPVLLRPIHPARVLLGGASSSPSLADLPGVDDLLAHPGLDRLLARLEPEPGSDPRLRTAPTREYLAWRYRDVPGLDYRAVWSDTSECEAALVVRARLRRGRREISIAEVMAPADGDGVRAAASLVTRLAGGGGADYLVTSVSAGTPERAAARAAGLVPAPGLGPRLFVRQWTDPAPLSPHPGQIRDWRLGTGALEIF